MTGNVLPSLPVVPGMKSFGSAHTYLLDDDGFAAWLVHAHGRNWNRLGLNDYVVRNLTDLYDEYRHETDLEVAA